MSDNFDSDIDPDLLGRMGHISRQRNVSMKQVKNMALRVGIQNLGESTEYDKVILGYRLLNQRLDLLLQPLYECQGYELDAKFSVGFISLTHRNILNVPSDLHFLWEEEMLKVLVDIEEIDPRLFLKIKRNLKDFKKIWRYYPELKEDYQQYKKDLLSNPRQNLDSGEVEVIDTREKGLRKYDKDRGLKK